MIISGKQVQDVLKLYADQGQKTKSQAKPQTTSSKRDEVVLSPKAQEFGQLLQKLKAMPDVREEKTAALSKQIESGEYRIEAKDIADKMIGRALADRLR